MAAWRGLQGNNSVMQEVWGCWGWGVAVKVLFRKCAGEWRWGALGVGCLKQRQVAGRGLWALGPQADTDCASGTRCLQT